MLHTYQDKSATSDANRSNEAPATSWRHCKDGANRKQLSLLKFAEAWPISCKDSDKILYT